MKVIVYVEGPSDSSGLEKLLDPVIQNARERGASITFHPLGGKRQLLSKGPVKALGILRNVRNAYVFLLPDLYPRDMGVPHSTPCELRQALTAAFDELVERRGLAAAGVAGRFRVHCMKYDLEALILANADALRSRVGNHGLPCTWTIPVEDQDFGDPPKRVVERAFTDQRRRYKDTVDAPWIMERSDLQETLQACPQCFAPFVEDLQAIVRSRGPVT